MDCRLHFKDGFFVSAPWYLQDKKHSAFLRRNQGHRRRIEAGEVGGAEGFVSIRSNGLSFLMFLQRELRIKGLLLPKDRERKKIQNQQKL